MIYLDNGATTPIIPEVVEVIQKSMVENFGNPSSVHQFGRKAKSEIEKVRKNIAKQFNVSSSEIIFTSCGTEGNNFILKNAVENLGVKHIVTSKIEHHAVLNVVKNLQKLHHINILYVNLDENGQVDLADLQDILSKSSEKTLVSLMTVNNEIGNILPIDKVCEICKEYNTLFHSDTVQAVGHYEIDLQKTPVDFITASGHKFHAPKGIGFVYVKKGTTISSMILGGGQEKGVRAGTENVHSIIGMGKAIEIAYKNLENDAKHQKELKQFFIDELKKISDKIEFNGMSADLEKSSYAILNVRFPKNDGMFLFSLDLKGIAVSGGSACQSGASNGSHVLNQILDENELQKTSIRFSFSKLTTKNDIQKTIEVLKELI